MRLPAGARREFVSLLKRGLDTTAKRAVNTKDLVCPTGRRQGLFPFSRDRFVCLRNAAASAGLPEQQDYFLASLLESAVAFGVSPGVLLGPPAIAAGAGAAVGAAAGGGVVGLIAVGVGCGGCSLVQAATVTVAKAKTRIVCFIRLAPPEHGRLRLQDHVLIIYGSYGIAIIIV